MKIKELIHELEKFDENMSIEIIGTCGWTRVFGDKDSVIELKQTDDNTCEIRFEE